MSLVLLKILVGIAGATFLGLGLRFLVLGGRIAGKDAPVSDLADSNIRYFGVIGIGYAALMWQNIPSISVKSNAFYTIISVIFAGGVVRLLTLIGRRAFNREVLLAAIPEIVLPPLVFLLQRSIT